MQVLHFQLLKRKPFVFLDSLCSLSPLLWSSKKSYLYYFENINPELDPLFSPLLLLPPLCPRWCRSCPHSLAASTAQLLLSMRSELWKTQVCSCHLLSLGPGNSSHSFHNENQHHPRGQKGLVWSEPCFLSDITFYYSLPDPHCSVVTPLLGKVFCLVLTHKSSSSICSWSFLSETYIDCPVWDWTPFSRPSIPL